MKLRLNILLFAIALTAIVFISSCKEDTCAGEACSSHGTYSEVLDTCICICNTGFSGIRCEVEDLCITQNITCGTNSYCSGGICTCISGYEGNLCSTLSYTKYVGSYQVSENCTTTFSGNMNQQFSSSINVGFDIDILTINNFANRGLPVDATIVSANFLTITSQNTGSVQVSGGEGVYEVFANRIRFEYNYTAGSNFHQCTAIFTRF